MKIRWGSVAFFKRLFLGMLLLAVVVPSVLSVAFGVGCARLRREAETLKTENGTLSGRLEEALSEARGAESAMERADAQLKELLEERAQADAARAREGGIDYQTLYPDLYCDAEQGEEEPENTVFLTFDDGPSERTAEILDILKRYGVKATFFIIGKNADTERGRELLRRIVDEGHTLGIHTYTHVYREIYASVDAYLEDFNRTYELIYEATGTKPTVFRFPGGSINSYNRGTYEEIIAEMLRRGFTFYDWNVDAGDAAPGGGDVYDAVVSGCRRQSRPVVLMHDAAGKKDTVGALERVIETLLEDGYGFGRLTPLIRPVSFSYKS
ncbi:MAG TPA: polysaccharide deacetylase family protein [Oscillospiraceae bacterium]|nr:polysaccharide deacetylase family protein [Oscillospiraceae bacterium]